MDDKYYKSYKCKGCGKEIILIANEVKKTLDLGKFLACAHCGCKKLREEKITDDLRECMDHSSWKKVSGVIRQVR